MNEVLIFVRELVPGDRVRLDRGDVIVHTVVGVQPMPGRHYRLYVDDKPLNTKRVKEYPRNGMVWLVSSAKSRPQ